MAVEQVKLYAMFVAVIRPLRVFMTSLLMFLQSATAGGGEQRRWKDWVLEKETELRLEVPEGAAVDIKVCA